MAVLLAWLYSLSRWLSTDWITEMSLAMLPHACTSLTAAFRPSALPLPELRRLLTAVTWVLAAGFGAVVAGLVGGRVGGRVGGGVGGSDVGSLVGGADVAAGGDVEVAMDEECDRLAM